MSTRSTRSRTVREGSDTHSVKDYFRTTRRPVRTRGEKKLIEEDVVIPFEAVDEEIVGQNKAQDNVIPKKEKSIEPEVVIKKSSRTRARTPSRQAELSTKEVTGTPPKKSRDARNNDESDVVPTLKVSEEDIVLSEGVQEKEKPVEKSGLDELMRAAAEQKKKKACRTVADLQARLAQKGAARAIHEQNLQIKTKKVDEHVELLKSPKKQLIIPATNVKKSKAVRSLVSKERVPEYVVPGGNVMKSAEKIREDEDAAFEAEGAKRTADFLKTSRLIDEVKDSAQSTIGLPDTYQFLLDGFQHLERVASFSQNKACIASELFKNVKNTLQKDFSSRHFSQILHVYPQSYHAEMKEQRKAFSGLQAGKYELEVRPNLSDDLEGFLKDEEKIEQDTDLPMVRPIKPMPSPMKSPRKKVQPALRLPELNTSVKLDAARMRDRRYIFRHKLNIIVEENYRKFLETQGITTSTKRIHPLFDLNKHCSDIELKKLPEPPIQKNTEHIGMREYMEKNLDPNYVEMPTFLQKAMDDLKSPQKSTTGASGDVPLSPKKFAQMQNEKKSKGAMSLLERIRAKEACKKAAESCVDESLKIRKTKLNQLIRSRYLKSLYCLYASKKKSSMELTVAADSLIYNTSVPTSKQEIVELLEFLCTIAPLYVNETIVMGKKFLRIIDNNYEGVAELVRDELEKVEGSLSEQAKLASQTVGMFPSIATRPASPKVSKAIRSLKFAG